MAYVIKDWLKHYLIEKNGKDVTSFFILKGKHSDNWKVFNKKESDIHLGRRWTVISLNVKKTLSVPTAIYYTSSL